MAARWDESEEEEVEKSDKGDKCMLCLEVHGVQKIGHCKHLYCKNCLLPNIVEQLRGNEPIVCPACQPSYKSSKVDLKQKETNTITRAEQIREEKDRKERECNDYFEAQSSFKDALTMKLDKTDCESHGKLLEQYCVTCSAVICPACVPLEHSGHVTMFLNDVIATNTHEIRISLQHKENQLDNLKAKIEVVKVLKFVADEKESALVKKIDSHASRCIGEIMKSKEVLIQEMKKDNMEATWLQNDLKLMEDVSKESARAIADAHRLLARSTELTPAEVDMLHMVKKRLRHAEERQSMCEVKRKKSQRIVDDLPKETLRFYPRMFRCEIGGFKNPGPKCSGGGPCICSLCGEARCKLPNANRVVDCRRIETCKCGTGGSSFNRNMLSVVPAPKIKSAKKGGKWKEDGGGGIKKADRLLKDRKATCLKCNVVISNNFIN